MYDCCKEDDDYHFGKYYTRNLYLEEIITHYSYNAERWHKIQFRGKDVMVGINNHN